MKKGTSLRREQKRQSSYHLEEWPPAPTREADCTPLNSSSLLLLLLLLRKLRHGLGAQRFRSNHRGRRQLLRLRRVHRRHRHHHAQFTRRVALVNAPRRWHVRIIPPDRHANVPLAPLQIIRRIERHPPQIP